METLSPSVSHRRWVFAVLAIGLLLIAPNAPRISPSAMSLPSLMTDAIPAQPIPAQPLGVLPFTMQDVVLFLSTNFEITPVESSPGFARFIYTERADGTGDEIMNITVDARSGDLNVAFTFREWIAMHYVAEFIECPLFTRAESEQLYALLYSSDGARWEPLGRFKARAAFSSVGETTEVAFEFGVSPIGQAAADS